MKKKKNNRANLENQRGVFLQAGFIITLSFVLIAFEWTAQESTSWSYDTIVREMDPEQEIVNTYRKDEIKPPPPIPADEFIIRGNDEKIEHLFDPLPQDITEESIIWFPPEYIEPEVDENRIFTVVEFMPRFRGGDLNSFWKFIQSEITYPEEAIRLGIQGTVLVQFVVDEKGNVTQVTLTRKIDPYLDQEAIRVIRSSPKWEPGIQAGKPVSVMFSIPVKFVLQ
jgi:protein TonB